MGETRKLSSRPPKILKPYLAADGPNDEGEWAAHCPLHADDDPSAYFNFEKGVWICHAKCGAGLIKELVDELRRREANGRPSPEPEEDAEVKDFVGEKLKRGGAIAPSIELTDERIEQWNDSLLTNQAALQRFTNKRGLDEATIITYKLGWDVARKAYTIPIPDRNGKWTNVRFYRPDANGKMPKYQNLKGHGRLSLFPIASLLRDDIDYVVLTEGELDALICIMHGIPAVCGTGGARNWNPGWNQFFAGKRVWIVYDQDQTGVLGRRKVLQNLRVVAKALYVVELPFEFKQEHGNDITDFFVKDGRPISEFRRLLREAEPDGSKPQLVTSTAPTRVRVTESFNPSHIGAPLELEATVIGRSFTTHVLPKHVDYSCTMDAGPKCDICPMYQNSGSMEADISASDTFLLKFMDVADEKKDDLVRQYKNIAKCNRMDFDVTEHWSVESLVVRSDLEQTEDDADHTQREVVAVGPHDTKASDSVRFVGTTVSNPKNQTNTFQAWEASRDAAAFEAFQMRPDIGKRLEVFQPANGQKPGEKLIDIGNDLSAHVTRIYGRPHLHVAMDLVYHSAIAFSFAGEPIDRGWLDILVLGDTRTGKSKTAQKLSEHYGLGSMLSCESASFAGIFGGLSQRFGREWVVTWGAVVLNDRRIVILDEVSALSTGEISQMSAVRSSGIAKLTKIETQEARARTRLIWIANPRDGKNMEDATYGVEHIRPLVGNNEDIARFDFAMAVTSDEVEYDEVRTRASHEAPRYNQDDARALILWVWSRKAEQIHITEEATDAIDKYGLLLSQRYTESPPLVQSTNIRQKLARISVAIAGRLFSTDASYERLIVTAAHAKTAYFMLNSFYDAPHFGYRHSSMQMMETRHAALTDRDDAKRWLAGYPDLVHFLKATRGAFAKWDLVDATGRDQQSIGSLTSGLFRRSLITMEKGQMALTPIAHDIIREL